MLAELCVVRLPAVELVADRVDCWKRLVVDEVAIEEVLSVVSHPKADSACAAATAAASFDWFMIRERLALKTRFIH